MKLKVESNFLNDGNEKNVCDGCVVDASVFGGSSGSGTGGRKQGE